MVIEYMYSNNINKLEIEKRSKYIYPGKCVFTFKYKGEM